MLSAWSVGLAIEIQSEKTTFVTKSGQHLLIKGEEHPAHDQTNTAHLLANKRRNQFTNYQKQISYSDYCKLLLASLFRARQIPCQHCSWVSTASSAMPFISLLTAICRSTLHTVIAIHKITNKLK
jgi:hypothetical protein